MLKILTLGDVVGTAAISYLRTNLWSARSRLGVDFVIANGENATDIHGLSAPDAEALLDSGIDLLTMGNHTYGRRDLYGFLDSDPRIIRPANFPPAAPGQGYVTVNVCGYRLLVINVQGQIYMNSTVDNPFIGVERLLTRLKGQYDFAVCDFHGEATSEKAAFAACFDGKISAIWGTHTHVQTADERVLPGGSGFISDLGMCGVEESIIGTRAEQVVKFYKTGVHARDAAAEGRTVFCGCLFDIDPQSGRCLSVKRIRI